VPRLVVQLVVDYFAYAARPGDSAHRAARRRLLLPRRAAGCLGTSRGSSSTASPTPRVRVPCLVTWLVAPLVVDYFAYAARPGASARRAARHTARHRLLRVRRASGCLSSSRGSSRGSSSTTSTTPRVRVPRLVARLVTRLVVDYFDSATRPGASARSAACHAARRAARHAARRRLLRLCRTSGCLGTSRGSSRGSSCRSSSTSSPTPCVRVPRHVARLITRLVAPLVVDFFAYTVRQGASACRAARRRLLRLRRTSGCLGTSRGSSRGSSSTTLCVATLSCGHTSSTSATPYIVTTCLAATLALL
jgi:hypothetical protein